MNIMEYGSIEGTEVKIIMIKQASNIGGKLKASAGSKKSKEYLR